MANTKRCFSALDEAALLQLAACIAKQLPPRLVIYLHGTLGAGKTTFSRGLIQALGHHGAVKSPTYTLLEPYLNLSPAVLHFDLYRLSDAEELEYIGMRDYLDSQAIFLIEWPECGQGFLPEADLAIQLAIEPTGLRKVQIDALTPIAQQLLEQIA